MPGISFDRAAAYYDATRGYLPGVAGRIADAIVREAGLRQGDRLLEMGIGTGRIALPLLALGYTLIGVDISLQMMARLREQRPATMLAQADITMLPFDPASFDAVLSVHVLHLVNNWEQALAEARRVLRPGGRLVLGYDEHPGEHPDAPEADLPGRQVHERWAQIRAELGRPRKDDQPGVRTNDPRLAGYLRETGAQVRLVHLTDYKRPPLSPLDVVAACRERIYSADWGLPDDLHAEAVRRLEEWVAVACPEPERPSSAGGRFMALIAQW